MIWYNFIFTFPQRIESLTAYRKLITHILSTNNGRKFVEQKINQVKSLEVYFLAKSYSWKLKYCDANLKNKSTCILIHWFYKLQTNVKILVPWSLKIFELLHKQVHCTMLLSRVRLNNKCKLQMWLSGFLDPDNSGLGSIAFFQLYWTFDMLYSSCEELKKK